MKEGKIKLRVSEACYAIARVNPKSKIRCPFFALINDGKEITVVAKEEEIEGRVDEIEKGFRLKTFETILPFNTVGFIAQVSSALASKNIPILVFSSYSTDHVLVKAEHLQEALQVLQELGFQFDLLAKK